MRHVALALVAIAVAFAAACGPTLRIAPIEAWSDELDATVDGSGTYAHGGWFIVTQGKSSSVMFCRVDPELECSSDGPNGTTTLSRPSGGGGGSVIGGGSISY